MQCLFVRQEVFCFKSQQTSRAFAFANVAHSLESSLFSFNSVNVLPTRLKCVSWWWQLAYGTDLHPCCVHFDTHLWILGKICKFWSVVCWHRTHTHTVGTIRNTTVWQIKQCTHNTARNTIRLRINTWLMELPRRALHFSLMFPFQFRTNVYKIQFIYIFFLNFWFERFFEENKWRV